MILTNEFEVSAPVDQAWSLLTDIERIAPCVPGFQLEAVDDDKYSGAMKVKVGAVRTTYDCVVRFVERDESGHRATIAAQGKESRGQGGVTAEIVSTLTEVDGGRTRASVVTTLDVTGRVAQFGRGILADVSNRLVKQFVKQLEAELLAPEPHQRDAPIDAGTPGVGGSGGPAEPLDSTDRVNGGRAGEDAASTGPSHDAEPLDLLSVAGAPLVKRAGLALALALAACAVVALLRPRGGR